ncbi:hypothetical protein FRX31_002813 [Thalictrum thalictroides]|uniref:Uncharacterized protein n=1 Tax=Thalictrum thalictroides TaxID=46969 RepID=A0A7J6XGG8_THATH|nr:hypothetical protein FRX31_002813 [Thalictrum thalictroides]
MEVDIGNFENPALFSGGMGSELASQIPEDEIDFCRRQFSVLLSRCTTYELFPMSGKLHKKRSNLTDGELDPHSILAWKEGKYQVNRQSDRSVNIVIPTLFGLNMKNELLEKSKGLILFQLDMVFQLLLLICGRILQRGTLGSGSEFGLLDDWRRVISQWRDLYISCRLLLSGHVFNELRTGWASLFYVR